MTSVSAVSPDGISDKEMKKDVSVIKRIVDRVKLGSSDSARITSALRGINRTISKVQDTTKATTVKAYHMSYVVLARFPLFLFFLYILIFYLGDIYSSMTSSFISFFDLLHNYLPRLFIPQSSYGILSVILVFIIFLAVFIYIFPGIDDEWRRGFVLKIFMVYVIVLLVLVFWWSVTGNPDNDFETNVQIAKDRMSDSGNSIWNTLKCAFSYTSECFAIDDTQTAKISDKAEFDVTFDSNELHKSYTLSSVKSSGVVLPFYVKNSDAPIFLDKIECYLGSVKSGNLFYEKDLEKRKIQNSKKEILSDVRCIFKEDYNMSKKEDIVSVVVVLYYSLEGTYSQPMPVYNFEEFANSLYGGYENYNDLYSIKENIEEEARDSGLTEPQKVDNAIDFDIQMNELPFIFNVPDGFDEKGSLSFSFAVKKNSFYPDTLTSLSLKDVSVPSYLDFSGDVSSESLKGNLDVSDDEAYIDFSLVLSNPYEDRAFFTEDMKFKMISTFKKKKTIEIKIRDADFEEESDTSSLEVESSSSEDIVT